MKNYTIAILIYLLSLVGCLWYLEYIKVDLTNANGLTLILLVFTWSVVWASFHGFRLSGANRSIRSTRHEVTSAHTILEGSHAANSLSQADANSKPVGMFSIVVFLIMGSIGAIVITMILYSQLGSLRIPALFPFILFCLLFLVYYFFSYRLTKKFEKIESKKAAYHQSVAGSITRRL